MVNKMKDFSSIDVAVGALRDLRDLRADERTELRGSETRVLVPPEIRTDILQYTTRVSSAQPIQGVEPEVFLKHVKQSLAYEIATEIVEQLEIKEQVTPHGTEYSVAFVLEDFNKPAKPSYTKKYEVHWVHHQLEEDKTHGQFDTLQEAIDSVYAWWKQNKYDPVYVRQFTIDGNTTLDYGFHHMFYVIKEINVLEG